MGKNTLAVIIALWTLMEEIAGQIDIIKQWNLISYNLPSDSALLANYEPENGVPVGMEVGWDKIYVTTPRLWPGNPATISWIPRSNVGGISPPLTPYPSAEWHAAATTNTVYHTRDNCTNIISVFRIKLDKCNRLWVLDSGVVDVFSDTTTTALCPPKILVFDTRNDELVKKITFPWEVVRASSLFTNLVIDDNTLPESGVPDCDNVFVYMSDSRNPAIVVYDARRDVSWRLSHPKMFPHPDFGIFRVAGETFTLMDGIIGLALSNPIYPLRKLYFQPFASDRIYSIATSVLQADPNTGDDSDLPVVLEGQKSSQAAPLAVDPRDGALIFNPVSESAVVAWIPDSHQFGSLAYDPNLLQMVLDIRVAERDDDNVWLLATRFQKHVRRTINREEVNIRILRVKRSLEQVFGNGNSTYLSIVHIDPEI